MQKTVTHSVEARKKLKEGVDILANAVKATLGPKGRNVIIEKRFNSPLITKDGVTVAKEVIIIDPIQKMGARLVKDVASKTADEAGDGTTTSTVLAQAIISKGIKALDEGANPLFLKKGIDVAVKGIIDYLRNNKVEVTNDKIKEVAMISANGDKEIGKLIEEAVLKIGRRGIITVEEARGINTYIEISEGMQLDRGYLSPYFINNREKSLVELDNVRILMYNKKISNVKDILHILESAINASESILFIVDDMDGEALSTLSLNVVNGTLNCCVIKAPDFGEYRKDALLDIEVLVGGGLASDEIGKTIKTLELKDLGFAKKVIVSKDTTTIIGGNGGTEDIAERCALIEEQIANTIEPFDIDKRKLRLAKLSSGVATLYVGAKTEIEMKEKKDRVDDALHATRAALEEGIVPGGGTAIIKAAERVLISILDSAEDNQDESFIQGMAIIFSAVEEPLRQICYNANLDSDSIIDVVSSDMNFWNGFNAYNEKHEDLFLAGVIDPFKVTRVALENSASIASMFLTTEVVLTNPEFNQ